MASPSVLPYARIAFQLTAFVVDSFVVTPYNRLQARMASGEEETALRLEHVLLTEIRDLLAGRPGSPNVRGPGGLS